MTFKDITLEDMPLISSILECSGGICDFTAGTVYTWSGIYRYAYSYDGRDLVIRSTVDGEDKYYVPVGDLDRVLGALPEDATLAPVTEEQARGRGVELTDYSDYVYLVEDLATLKGKRYHSKRNHVNTFLRTYPGSGYVRITEANAPRVREFLEGFDVSEFSEAHRLEHRATVEALGVLELINCIGAYLEVNGRIVAMTVGEIVGDTLYVHAEKADTDYRGAYEAMAYEFVRREAIGLTYVNREEDMGNEGLRRAKQSYHPIKMIKKYQIVRNSVND